MKSFGQSRDKWTGFPQKPTILLPVILLFFLTGFTTDSNPGQQVKNNQHKNMQPEISAEQKMKASKAIKFLHSLNNAQREKSQFVFRNLPNHHSRH